MLLLLLPLFFLIKNKNIIAYPTFSIEKGAKHYSWPHLGFVFFLLAVVCFVFAGAKPYRKKTTQRELQQKFRIVFLLDHSESMKIVDLLAGQKPDQCLMLPKSRQAIAQQTIRQFMTDIPNADYGLIVFGSEAYDLCPETAYSSVLLDRLNQLSKLKMPDGTAITKALQLAFKHLSDHTKKNQPHFILLSDGVDHSDENPLMLPEWQQFSGAFQLDAIGIGGENAWHKWEHDGEIRWSKVAEVLDDRQLQLLAKKGGGGYYLAPNAASLEKMMQQLADQHRMNLVSYKQIKFVSYQLDFLIAGLLFLFASIILYHFKPITNG